MAVKLVRKQFLS